MATVSYRQVVQQGLWTNNPGLVQLLGLCPLLAVSNTLVNALGLGLATMLVLMLSNAVVSLIRPCLLAEIRLPVFVLVIASLVTTVELLLHAFFHELHRVLGIFIPLIVTNCAILGRAEAFASKNNLYRSLLDGMMMGLGFALLLIVLGGARELLGQGTLFSGMHLLFGDGARDWTLQLSGDDGYRGFLLALLPPGAFIGMGLLIALKNTLNGRHS
jgi:electron transport complex protein RnfE